MCVTVWTAMCVTVCAAMEGGGTARRRLVVMDGGVDSAAVLVGVPLLKWVMVLLRLMGEVIVGVCESRSGRGRAVTAGRLLWPVHT